MNSTVWETQKRSGDGAKISMNIPPRTLLYSLEPIGLGTLFVESFTSHVMHLAAEQALSTKQLAAVALLGERNPSDDVVEFFWNTHVLDGVRVAIGIFRHSWPSYGAICHLWPGYAEIPARLRLSWH